MTSRLSLLQGEALGRLRTPPLCTYNSNSVTLVRCIAATIGATRLYVI